MIPTTSISASPSPPTAEVLGTLNASERLCHHDAILLMTADVFPGARIELGAGIDPETEGEEFPVVSVLAVGAVEDLVARGTHWHREMRAIVGPGSDSYRLDLHVA